MESRVGDKVRLKGTRFVGQKGVIGGFSGDRIVVRLDEGAKVRVAADSMTNFSLAARKAWRTHPGRKVGRPKGSRKADRVAVTLRVDREIWERFKASEAEELITDRSGTINGWLREKLEELSRAAKH